MTLKEFIKLFILQKDARETSKKEYSEKQRQEAKQKFVEEYNQLMRNVAYDSCDKFASSLYFSQPDIPFVLFKPKSATAENPAPLIVHTHGGPFVYMDKNEPHAEIAYFIAQGFIVVCPNYRGSTGYPEIGNEEDRNDWKQWETKSKNKHHLYGPQDVYAVTKCVMDMSFVAKDKIYLRGGSYGSCINAHLLAEIKKGTYENIYKGAHLSGGTNYPIPSSMPDDIPLLITHAEKDNKIAPFRDVRLFMEKMLLKQLALELDGIEVNNIQTFVSKTGNHHLIDPLLKCDDNQSASYKELETYLQHATEFFHVLTQGKKYQKIEAFDQCKKLMFYKYAEENSNNAEENSNNAEENSNNAEENSNNAEENSNNAEENSDNAEENSEFELFRRLYAYQISRQLAQKDSVEKPKLPQIKQLPKESVGPTCSLLKLQLKDKYSGNITQDLHNYLHHHFEPTEWYKNKKCVDAGKLILRNNGFVEQLVQVIEQEEYLLHQYPNHMVMYHAAEPNTLQLYTFINLWREILLNKPINTLPVINEMRMYAFMKNTFDDIKIFLQTMRPFKATEKYFNYVPGFQERAISCNPSLLSNAHNTAVSSLWLYFDAKESKYVPIGKIVMDLLSMLGIYSEERVERYMDLFARELIRAEKPQALLQQLFVPYEIAENSAYMCQIWGEEFKDNPIHLDSPSIIKQLIHDPVHFEEELRKNKDAFTNLGDCLGFGDTEHGFNYANCQQHRYLLGNHQDVFTFSYFRDIAAHQEFVINLCQLIREDYADFLASCNTLPNFIVKGAQIEKQILVSQTKLGIFKSTDQVNIYAFLLQQQELYAGLVQNPTQEWYGEIFALSKADKIKVQKELRVGYAEHTCYVLYTFSLCWDLEGYTYYDLLQEAATATLGEEDSSFVMEKVALFSTPSSAKNTDISEEQYDKLARLLQENIVTHKYNPLIHQFVSEGVDAYTLWQTELSKAIDCFMPHAHLAKKRCIGHDIEAEMEAIYLHIKEETMLPTK